jgi:hypothetical protein
VFRRADANKRGADARKPEHFDLAAVDILRDRERGVPRYNQFRRLIHKDPVKFFDEITDKRAWREQLRRVDNNDIEAVDLMAGRGEKGARSSPGTSEDVVEPPTCRPAMCDV